MFKVKFALFTITDTRKEIKKKLKSMLKLCKQVFKFQTIQRGYGVNVDTLHGTLHSRFFEHLQDRTLKCDPKLKMMMKLFQEDPKDHTTVEFRDRCKELDGEFLRRLRSNQKDIIGVIDTLIETMPERVTGLESFTEALRMLLARFEKNPTRKNFVKLCFYFGLLKKKSPGPILLTDLVDNYFDKIIDDRMSSIDFAIICTATYKASVAVKSEKFKQRLVQEVVKTDQPDAFIFVTFIKSLRQNKINSREVLNKLKDFCKSGQMDQLNYQPLVHILPLIADNSIKDDELTEFFIERCMSTMSGDVRAKDIQKFIYSCAILNFPVKLEHLQKLKIIAMTRTNHKEFQQKFDNFVDVALSMWMLNFRCHELVEKLLNDSRFHRTGGYNRIKIDSRKKLLLTCVEIEEPSWLNNIEIKSQSFDEQRAAPKYLIKPSLVSVMNSLKGQNTKIVQQIMNLNIAGILVREKDGKLVHFEVLDQTNSLSDKKSPTGIFALKLRLLNELGCDVRLVSQLLF